MQRHEQQTGAVTDSVIDTPPRRSTSAAIQLLSGVGQTDVAHSRKGGTALDPVVDALDLPAQPGPLIGRDALLDSSLNLLAGSDVHLVTFTGPGGVGKTRLACEVARLAAPAYDLVRFIDLAPLGSDQLLAAISDAVGVVRRQGVWLDPLRALLRRRRTLLVLDNFEHILDAAAQVAQLLVATENLDIIATSREPLRIRWERLVRVPPLEVPAEVSSPDGGLSIEEIVAIPAVRLFVSQVQRLHPGFELDEENAPVVAELCRRLDGLPLAIEMAAAKLQVCSPRQLLNRLTSRLDALGPSLRDLPDRQASLQATVEWSYRRLTPFEQLTARQAAIFAGGGDVDAAQAVISLPPEAGSVEDMLIALAEKSLIDFDPLRAESPRFTMLKTVREYLLDQLTLEGERTDIEQRFESYYADLADIQVKSLSGCRDVAAVWTLRRERDNFWAILESAINRGDPEAALRLAVALTGYWYRDGQLAEASEWFDRLLSYSVTPEWYEHRLAALHYAGRVAYYRGHLRTAADYLEELLTHRDAVRSSADRRAAIFELAHIQLARGSASRAEALLEEATSLLRTAYGTAQLAENRYLRSAILASYGRYHEARSLLSDIQQSFDADEAGDVVTRAMLMLADLDLLEGSLTPAEDLYSDAVCRARQALNSRLEVHSHVGLGIVASQRSDERSSLSHIATAFEIADRHGDELAVAMVIDALSTQGLSGSSLRPEWLQLAGLADVMFDRLGVACGALERQRTAFYRRNVRDILGEEEADRVETEGRQLSLDDARARLDEIQPEEWTRPAKAESSDAGGLSELERLTRREREVVRLIAKGWTNRQIALELDIAERTVDSHVNNIFRKLEVSSRVSVAAWAVELGLANR